MSTHLSHVQLNSSKVFSGRVGDIVDEFSARRFKLNRGNVVLSASLVKLDFEDDITSSSRVDREHAGERLHSRRSKVLLEKLSGVEKECVSVQ